MGDRPLRPAMSPIVSARLYEVETRFATPYRLSKTYGTLASTRAVFLKLVDADGVEGWGEANPMQPFTAESTEQSLKELEAALLPAVFASPNPEPGPIDVLLDRLVPGYLCAKGASARRCSTSSESASTCRSRCCSAARSGRACRFSGRWAAGRPTTTAP